MTFTAREKYDDAMREVKLRERVYARMVNVGDLSLQLALRRIEIMKEIAFEYKEQMKREDLFGEDTVPTSRRKADRRDERPPRDAGPDRVGQGPAEEGQPPSPPQTD